MLAGIGAENVGWERPAATSTVVPAHIRKMVKRYDILRAALLKAAKEEGALSGSTTASFAAASHVDGEAPMAGVSAGRGLPSVPEGVEVVEANEVEAEVEASEVEIEADAEVDADAEVELEVLVEARAEGSPPDPCHQRSFGTERAANVVKQAQPNDVLC